VISRRFSPVTALLLCFAQVFAWASGQHQSGHARVDLLAKQDAIVPGKELRLGIHFVLEPGWHIYWTNPGDSGQPPVLKWQLPEGFSAGEIQWPRPERMQSTPQLADYGYNGEVLLPVMVQVPPSARAGSSVAIAAEVKWLVCREVCIPEHAQLYLNLPVAPRAKEKPQSAALFAETEKLLPHRAPRSWRVVAHSENDDFVLSVEADRRLMKAEFFPLEANQIDNAAPQKLQSSPNGAKITLKKSELLTKPVEVLRGVLVLGGGAAYRIEAPVH
jgi:DsbC/DsbD-like thiol-disulfide interchange protein